MNDSIVSPSGKIICPRCEVPADLLSYKTLQIPEGKYADQCAQILKCENCKFVFAPIGYRFFKEFINTQDT